MLKNSLFQPSLSFSFSAAPFFPFLLQRPFFLLFLSGQCAVSLTFQRLTFLFFRRVALFLAQVLSPKRFSVQPNTFLFFFSFLFYFQRTFFISIQCLLLLLLFSAPFSFPSTPAFMFNFLPTSKAKNILSRCFTFLLFE